eukprot:2563809-Rhodomonas_salina.1
MSGCWDYDDDEEEEGGKDGAKMTPTPPTSTRVSECCFDDAQRSRGARATANSHHQRSKLSRRVH